MNVTIGARVVKTGIAVALALYITGALGFDGVIIAGVAAIFAIQPSVYRSWQHVLEQVQTNTLGAALALGVSYVLPVNEIVIGLTCVAVILIALALKMETTISLTLVTVIVVLQAGGDWMYALNRFSVILIGIGSAFIVNAAILPPNHQKQFLQGYQALLETLSLLLRTAISDELKENETRTLREKLHDGMLKMNERYGMLEEEWKKWRRFRPQPSRHLVVQKQLVRAMIVGSEVLDAVEEHYFAHRMRGEREDPLFDATIEELIRYHEYTLLKYNGKMKPGEYVYRKIGHRTERLLKGAIVGAQTDQETADGMKLVLVATAIFEYGHQLRRLDKLIENVRQAEDGKKEVS